MHPLDIVLAYIMNLLREAIDEEGCGAVIAAAFPPTED